MKFKEIIMYVLGVLVFMGFFAVTFYLIYTGKYEATIQLLVGALIGSFTTVIGYFYGSSKSSSDKNDIISKK